MLRALRACQLRRKLKADQRPQQHLNAALHHSHAGGKHIAQSILIE